MSQIQNLQSLVRAAQEMSKQPGGTERMAVALEGLKREQSSKKKEISSAPSAYAAIGTSVSAQTNAPSPENNQALNPIRPNAKKAAFLFGCLVGYFIIQAKLNLPAFLLAKGMTNSALGQGLLSVLNWLTLPVQWVEQFTFSKDGVVSIILSSVLPANEVTQLGNIFAIFMGCLVYGFLVRLLEVMIRRDLGGVR